MEQVISMYVEASDRRTECSRVKMASPFGDFRKTWYKMCCKVGLGRMACRVCDRTVTGDNCECGRGKRLADGNRQSNLVRAGEVVFQYHSSDIHRTFITKVEEPICALCNSPSPLDSINAPCQNRQNPEKRGFPTPARISEAKMNVKDENRPYLIAVRMQHWLDIARCW